MIQVKRGVKSTLPNPLASGELGWCTDTKELYMGTGTANDNQKVYGAPVTATVDIYVVQAAYGGRTAAQGADGKVMRAGTTTGAATNKLIDGAANFDSTYLNKTVHNEVTDRYAKITAVDSATQLTLSVNIMSTSQSYDISNAFDNLADGFSACPSPFYSNTHLHISDGTFSGDQTWIGKLAGGNFNLNVFGCSAVGYPSTLSGIQNFWLPVLINNLIFSNTVNFQANTIATLTSCTMQGLVNAYSQADVTWTGTSTTGSSRYYTFAGSASRTSGAVSTIVIGNNPENFDNPNGSTITKGFTLYVAASAYGGSDATGNGLALKTGSATSTTANKLVDSAASFDSTLVNKTVYNSLRDKWAKVTAVDSATQLSLSADIMISGDAYVISNAIATLSRAVELIPSMVNCNITVRMSDGSFSGTTFKGKAYSGNYYIDVIGTMTESLATQTVTSATQNSSTGQATVTCSAAWTVDAYQNKLLVFASNTTTAGLRGLEFIVDTNTATVMTAVGKWYDPATGTAYTPANTDTFKIWSWATTITSAVNLSNGQGGIRFKRLAFSEAPITSQDGSTGYLYSSYATYTGSQIYSVKATNNGAIYLYNSYLFSNTGTTEYNLYPTLAGFIGCYNIKARAAATTGAKYCLIVDSVSVAQIASSIFENATYGVTTGANSVLRAGGTPNMDETRIRNNGTGLWARQCGGAVGTYQFVYSGNTTNENIDATSYGWKT